MEAQKVASSDDEQQMAALAVILEMDRVDIQAGNFCDIDEFFAELDAEHPTS